MEAMRWTSDRHDSEIHSYQQRAASPMYRGLFWYRPHITKGVLDVPYNAMKVVIEIKM